MRTKKLLLIVSLLCIISMPFIYAEEFGYNLLEEPSTSSNITNIYNNFSVNGSDLYLNNISDVQVPSPLDGESLVWSSSLMKWISDTVISRWIVSTSNGYLYNDSDTVYFNDTKLNATIDARSGQTLNNSFHMYFTSSMANEVIWNFSESDQSSVDVIVEPGEQYIFGSSVT